MLRNYVVGCYGNRQHDGYDTPIHIFRIATFLNFIIATTNDLCSIFSNPVKRCQNCVYIKIKLSLKIIILAF